MSKRTKRLQKISRRLTTHQLRRLQEKDVALNYDELYKSGLSKTGSPYFLGYYSPSGIKYALEQYGFYEELHNRGFKNLKLSINTNDPYKQRIAIYTEEKKPSKLLGELVVKRRHTTVYTPFPSRIHGRTFEMIGVEWLCMQNPAGDFTPDKPRLPGQKYPGLGMGEIVMEILVIMCGRLRTAGLHNVPEHFHNAQMYTPQFKYIDPVYAGKRQAIVRDLLNKYSLPEISWAIDLKCVSENDNPFEWFVSEQVIPLDRDLKEYFESKEYNNYMEETAKQFQYRLDESCWEKKRNEIQNYITC